MVVACGMLRNFLSRKWKTGSREVEHQFLDENGKSVYARNFEFMPCQIDQLLDFIAKKNIEIRLSNAIVRAEGYSASERYNLSGKLTPSFGSSTFALVPGGWAPANIALDNAFALVDRNFVSEVGCKFKSGILKSGEIKDFIDFSNYLSFEANILAYAIEGNQRGKPSIEVIQEQLDEARSIINSALPNVTVFPSRKLALQAAMEVIDKSWEISEKRQEFFKDIAPVLMENIGISRRELVWNNICESAKKSGLMKNDVSVILSLSAASSKGKLNYAKKIIKPSKNYSDADAYNAASDITIMELFITTIEYFPQKKNVLVTKDKNLALFWAGFYSNSIAKIGDKFHIDARFYEKLFPDVEGWEDLIRDLTMG